MRERMLTAALSRCAPASRAHAFARSGCLCCAVITVVVVVGSRVVAEEGGCRGGRGGEQQRRDEVAHPVARCDGSVTIQWTARANGPFGRIARLSRLQERQQLRSRRDSDAEPLLPPPRMYVTARSPHAQTGVRAGHQSLCMHALSFFHKSFWLTRIREALEKSAPPPLLSFGSVLRLIPAMSAVPTGAATPGAKDGAVRPRSASPKGGKKVSVSAGMSLYGRPHLRRTRSSPATLACILTALLVRAPLLAPSADFASALPSDLIAYAAAGDYGRGDARAGMRRDPAPTPHMKLCV